MPDHNHHLTLPLAFSATSAAASLGWVAERCIRSAPNHLPCERCIESCPAQALFFVEENERSVKGQRLVASDACHGCAACLPSCPTEALLSSELQRLELKALEIACHRVDTSNTTTETLHCLRAVGVDQLVDWISRSPDQPISLCVAEACTYCEAAPAKQAKTDQWFEQMQALGVLQFVETARPYRAAEGAVMSRRRFMVASRPQQPVYAESDVGVRARRLQRYVTALQSGMSVEVKPLPQIQLDPQRCDASGVCSKVCPTDALQLSDQGALMFTPLDCISCGFCISHCPEQALTLSEAASIESIALREMPEATCFECGRAFSAVQVDPETQPVCPACRREKNLMKEGFSQLFG